MKSPLEPGTYRCTECGHQAASYYALSAHVWGKHGRVLTPRETFPLHPILRSARV